MLRSDAQRDALTCSGVTQRRVTQVNSRDVSRIASHAHSLTLTNQSQSGIELRIQDGSTQES